MFNKMKNDRVQMCFSDVRLETQAAAALDRRVGSGGGGGADAPES